jgi:hypothetical protein
MILTHFQRWILSWVRLGESLVSILTLARFYPGWSTGLLIRFMVKNCPVEEGEKETANDEAY